MPSSAIPALSTSPRMTDALSPSSSWPFGGVHVLPILEPSTEPNAPGVFHQCWAEWKVNLLGIPTALFHYCVIMQHILLLTFQCHRSALLAYVQFHVYQDPKVFLCQAALQRVTPLPIPVTPPPLQDFAFLFAELHETLVSPFFQPAEVPLNGNTTIWGMQTWHGCSVPSSTPFMKMLNSVGHSISPLVYTNNVGLQLDFVLLVTTL